VTVTVYDPIAGVTYGPAALPKGFFVAFDNYNGGIGFGSDGYGGPAYPVSIFFPGSTGAYQYSEISPDYSLTTPALVGGIFINCPAAGLGCDNTPLPEIPVTLSDGTTVPLSVSIQSVGFGQFWAQDEPPSHHWITVASMSQPRSGHTATLLSDGRVLVVGGAGSATSSTTAEIYDPSLNSWKTTVALSCGRTSHAATLLADGRVLVVGGTQCPQSAEIFDPVAQTWSPVTVPPIAYPGPTVELTLQDHRVIVVGQNGADLYDPVSGTWSATSGLTPVSEPVGVLGYPSVVLLDNGCLNGTTGVQTFDLATTTWTAGTPGPFCSNSGLTATALSGGLAGAILVTGWESSPPIFLLHPGDSAIGLWSLYLPGSDIWENGEFFTPEVVNLPIAGNTVAATLVDGRVLLVGGIALTAQPTSTSPSPTIPLPAQISGLFDPSYQYNASFWLPELAIDGGRTGHAVVTLKSGAVLVTGGEGVSPSTGALASVVRLTVPARLIETQVTATPSSSAIATSQALPVTVSIQDFPPPGTTAPGEPTGTVILSSGKYISAPATLSAGNVTITIPSGSLPVGSATLSANYNPDSSGSSIFLPSMGTAIITVGKNSQTITFGTAPSVSVGGTGTLSATASSGLAVTFTSSTISICTISGRTVKGVKAGTCTIAANQPGNSSYNPAPQVKQSNKVAKGSQTIKITAPSSITRPATGSVTATASSGLTVTLTSITLTICTISGSTVSGVAAGTCTIAANQAGNANYNPAPQVTRNIVVK
jgi:hypothetical protein